MKKTVARTTAATLILSSLGIIPMAAQAEASTYQPKLKSITMNGTPIQRCYGIVSNKTMYMPIWYVMQALDKLGVRNGWDGSTWDIKAPSYMPVDLSDIHHGGTGKWIQLNGMTIYRLNSIVYRDPSNGKETTYMPIWYIQQLLNRLGIGSTWDGQVWGLTTPPPMDLQVANPASYPTLHLNDKGYPVTLLQQKLNAAGYHVGYIDSVFGNSTFAAVTKFQSDSGVPSDGVVGQDTWLALNKKLAEEFSQSDSSASQSPVTAANKVVFAWTTTPNTVDDALSNVEVNRIGNDNFNLNVDGTVSQTPGTDVPTGLLGQASTNNVEVYATVTNFNTNGSFSGDVVHQVISSPTRSVQAEQNLVSTAVQKDYSGIDIDFENVNSDDKALFTEFVTELANRLHQAGKSLSVTVPARTGLTSEPWNSAYDYAAIGNVADWVPIMAYDFSWFHSKPGPIAPLWWDKEVLTYATSAIPSQKIIFGLPAYAYDWKSSNPNGWATAMSLNDLDTIIAQNNLTPTWDATDSEPFVQYTDAQHVSHTIYYENQASIQQKLSLADQFQLGGIAIWRAGLENQDFWNAIAPWATSNTSPTT